MRRELRVEEEATEHTESTSGPSPITITRPHARPQDPVEAFCGSWVPGATQGDHHGFRAGLAARSARPLGSSRQRNWRSRYPAAMGRDRSPSDDEASGRTEEPSPTTASSTSSTTSRSIPATGVAPGGAQRARNWRRCFREQGARAAAPSALRHRAPLRPPRPCARGWRRSRAPATARTKREVDARLRRPGAHSAPTRTRLHASTATPACCSSTASSTRRPASSPDDDRRGGAWVSITSATAPRRAAAGCSRAHCHCRAWRSRCAGRRGTAPTRRGRRAGRQAPFGTSRASSVAPKLMLRRGAAERGRGRRRTTAPYRRRVRAHAARQVPSLVTWPTMTVTQLGASPVAPGGTRSRDLRDRARRTGLLGVDHRLDRVEREHVGHHRLDMRKHVGAPSRRPRAQAGFERPTCWARDRTWGRGLSAVTRRAAGAVALRGRAPGAGGCSAHAGLTREQRDRAGTSPPPAHGRAP